MANPVGALRSGSSACELGIDGGEMVVPEAGTDEVVRGVLVSSSSANLPLERTFANYLEDTVKTPILRGGCVNFYE